MSTETEERTGEQSAAAAQMDDDIKTLHSLGYAQELARSMSRFSNFAISFSIICILAGGITSFQLAFSAVGGAGIGLGWPLVCVFSVITALTMAQVASAFPTAGGLYHWASILGGRGWGWATAWFNLAGLITVLAAINVGTYMVVVGSLGPVLGFDPSKLNPTTAQLIQLACVAAITLSQALFNHLGIKVTTLLTDFSGYLILVVSAALVAALLIYAPGHDFSRMVTFTNYSGDAGGGVWPQMASLAGLFVLGFLHAAYTITGFDASAHTAEETMGAAENVPRGIVSSVLISGIAGWILIVAVLLAIPNMDEAAKQGGNVFYWTVNNVLPAWLAIVLYVGVVLANYLCGLATVTSASRMVFAFARDGGLPFSGALRRVSPTYRTPATATWTVALLTIAFTAYTPVYSTITIVCVIFLYLSYVLPTFLGLIAYNRTWTKMGPWSIGAWYRPLAVICVLWCVVLIGIGMQPPNDKAIYILGGMLVVMAIAWFGFERKRFQGPPQGILSRKRKTDILSLERQVGQKSTGDLEEAASP